MKIKFIEVSNGFNWGKFLLMKFDESEWARRSEYGGGILLRELGWDQDFIWVLDLQTGEGAFFRPGGLAVADLEKHRIWVCLLYEPFLEWLYRQNLDDLAALPATVELPNAPAGLYGYRRSGKESEDEREQVLPSVSVSDGGGCEGQGFHETAGGGAKDRGD
jgi:hypothetical protein